MRQRPSVQDRRARLKRGATAELFGAAALLLKGWRILARGHAGHGGEIDIIATRGRVVAFVEVKARATRDSALLAIDPTKQHRFSRAVRHWMMRNPWAADYTLRADALLVTPWRWPAHVPDAFPLRL